MFFQLDSVQTQYSKLEKQTSSLQARLNNLQRRKEQPDIKEADILPVELLKKRTASEKKENKANTTCVKANTSAYESLGILLEWVSEVNLRHAITDEPTKPLEGLNNPEFIQEKCFKVTDIFEGLVLLTEPGNFMIFYI